MVYNGKEQSSWQQRSSGWLLFMPASLLIKDSMLSICTQPAVFETGG